MLLLAAEVFYIYIYFSMIKSAGDRMSPAP